MAAERAASATRPMAPVAAALIRPQSTPEVSAVLAACHAARQPVVVWGGLTGLVHGSDPGPGDLALSLERMAAIEEIDVSGRTATVQAGVKLQALQEAVEPHGLMFPLDLGARGTATLGGNVATNAGGNRVLRYGMMREMVLGVEAVLPDGTVVNALNRLIKNNSGYDLKHLFIGSEGTLGVVTRAVLRLRERPGSHDVALVGVADFSSVVALLKHVDRALGGQLSAFEVMWRDHYDLVTTPPALSPSPLPRGHPYYVLVEAHGSAPEADSTRFLEALAEAHGQGMVADTAVARSQSERSALWAIRDDVMQLRRHAPFFTFDVSLPISGMEAYVGAVRAALLERWPDGHCSVFGHIADGNLHIIFAPRAGPLADDARAAVEEIVYRPLAASRGAVSAEHGIGLEKKAYLGISRTREEIALMRLLKRTLDPHGVLNPGKVVDG
jgi:FAD/FMN-containing dehydrogenase